MSAGEIPPQGDLATLAALVRPNPVRQPGGWLRLCGQGGNCLEVRPLPGGGAEVRSSERAGEVARFDAAEWAALRSWFAGHGGEPS